MVSTVHASLKDIFTRSAARFAAGARTPADVVDPADVHALADAGVSAQELFDSVEDHAGYGEPDAEEFAAIHVVRRSYYVQVQGGKPSGRVVEASALPSKSAEALGIAWLPRIVAKARAKLRGELAASVMYGCAGDRQFLRSRGIAAADLLKVVWKSGDDLDAVYRWVASTHGPKGGHG